MPLDVKLNLPTTLPQRQQLTLDGWKRGVITLIDKSKIPRDALIEAQNLFLAENGTPKPRPGTDWYGTAPGSDAIDGATLYETSAEAPHLIVVAGGVIYRSTDDGATWDTCTGATLTAGNKVWFVQDHTYLYITNGADNITRYDGTTTLVTYTALSTPGTPTATKTGLSGSSYSHYYKVAAVNAVGFTAASAHSTVATSNLDRDSWDSSTNYITTSVSAVTGATRYDWYYSSDNVDYYYLASTAGTSYQDIGIPLNTNILAPTDNTTQGPKITRLEQIGSRLWGVQDTDNPYRVWFSGSGPYAGYYSSAYDGGYIDLMKGSQYRPVRVVDYRDGKGTPYATVWCSSPDGRGCIWQITLDTLTIGDIAITQPTAFRLPGSRGTDAPDSVVNVLNDYLFYNSQAFYNLGSRAQFLNLLSTDEISSNIRPTIQRITPTAASGICSIYDNAKVYFSVPYNGSTTNNRTIIYDTEQKAWLPEAFTVGFERFFQYVDSAGTRRLLAYKEGDTKLTEISSSIKGDYGVAFTTSLTTGLYPVSKNRFDFFVTEEGEVEFSLPDSPIQIQLLGIDRKKGYTPIKTVTIDNSIDSAGWSTFPWSTTAWTDTTTVPSLFAPSSEKNYFRVSREINAYQWNVVTSSLDSTYLLRTLQVNGTLSEGGKPRTWRIPD